MEPTVISYKEAIMYAALIGAGVGFVLGLIPLILGFVKGRAKVGLLGIVLSTLLGGIFSLLGIITAGVFTYLVLKKPAAPAESTVETEF